MKKSTFLSLALLLLMAFVGCTEQVLPDNAFLMASPTALNFGTLSNQKSFTLTNRGEKDLNWEITVSDPWLEVDSVSGTNDKVINVTVSRPDLPVGEHTGSIHISSNGGSADIDILVSIADIPMPAQVSNFNVCGITAPTGTFNPAMLQKINFPRGAMKPLGDMTVTDIEEAPMPLGYEGSFLLAWDAVAYAESYVIYIYSEKLGQYVVEAEVTPEDLEDPQRPTYLVAGSYKIGEQEKFKVAAKNFKGAGPVSEEDYGVIMAPTYLNSPANNTTTGEKPTFNWRQNEHAGGYIISLAQESKENTIWQEVIGSGDITQAHYPGDDPQAPSLQRGGTYLWYNFSQGPVDHKNKPLSYSLSTLWEFNVRD